ncbi:MAG: hypothetical protein Q8R57_05895 [Bacteroidota bacterium]|nr:hypothetical protein [Bacteroidota bacterium]
MESQILNKNIVVLGEFKPVQFDKLFFIKKNLFKEMDFLPTSIFLPELAIIETNRFLIEINQSKLTITYKLFNNDNESSYLNIEAILENSKVKAFGFNFKIDVFLNAKTESKKFFFFKENLLNNYFNSEDTAYGYFISKNLDTGRLNLDIKPVQLQKVGESKLVDALDFNFNFHFEHSEINSQIKRYAEFEEITKKIIKSYE